MEDATEKFHYRELDGKPLRLEPYFTLLLEHVTEIIERGEKMSLVADEKFGLVRGIHKTDNVALQQND